MDLNYIKCITFNKSNNIKVKRKIDGKTDFYSRCNDCSFRKFATIDKE